MTQQQQLKIGTICVALVLAGLVGSQLKNGFESNATRESAAPQKREAISLELGKIGSTAENDQQNSADSPTSRPKVGALRVGRIGATPTLEEIQSLRQLPLLDSQIKRAYALAKSMTCRMLTPGASVQPSASLPPEGESGTVGRVPAITIGLTMDPSGRSKLPAVTRGQVDEYFAKHRLSIQPIVYSDETGQLYFGTDCQAAFYEIERPGIAIKAEPMIESAVERFRSLGIASPVEKSEETNSSVASWLADETGRTLVMAFSFEEADLTISSIGQGGRKVTELLFFHLPTSQPESSAERDTVNARNPISMEVFLTSDERRTLHRLDLPGWNLNSPTPNILADVRFDKMILMGLYPAEPVVTDIHYRSAGIISMELVTQLMSGLKKQTAMSLDEVLDQFGLLSGAQIADDPPTVEKLEGVTDEDERWLREVARLKYDRLEKSLQSNPREDQPVAIPKVPLMTGLGK